MGENMMMYTEKYGYPILFIFILYYTYENNKIIITKVEVW
jgi:hypothetical protein